MHVETVVDDRREMRTKTTLRFALDANEIRSVHSSLQLNFQRQLRNEQRRSREDTPSFLVISQYTVSVTRVSLFLYSCVQITEIQKSHAYFFTWKRQLSLASDTWNQTTDDRNWNYIFGVFHLIFNFFLSFFFLCLKNDESMVN